MEDELQAMRHLVVQLQADNERLWQDRKPVEFPEPGAASASTVWPSAPLSADVSKGTVEWFMLIPRARHCPKFNGRSAIGIE